MNFTSVGFLSSSVYFIWRSWKHRVTEGSPGFIRLSRGFMVMRGLRGSDLDKISCFTALERVVSHLRLPGTGIKSSVLPVVCGPLAAPSSSWCQGNECLSLIQQALLLWWRLSRLPSFSVLPCCVLPSDFQAYRWWWGGMVISSRAWPCSTHHHKACCPKTPEEVNRKRKFNPDCLTPF